MSFVVVVVVVVVNVVTVVNVVNVFFANVTENGIPDKQTWHAGAPVISGVKYIATKWMRESTNQSS